MTHSHVHPIEVRGQIAGLAVVAVRFPLDYQWAAVDRLGDGSTDLTARGLQVGQNVHSVLLRAQFAF